MFLMNGFKAKLIKFNRNGKSLAYDDEDKIEEDITVIPYDMDDSVSFGTYTVPEATGSLMIRRQVEVKEGDQIKIGDKIFTVLKWADKWIYNRIEYKVVWIK